VGIEIDLLRNYPRSERSSATRHTKRKTEYRAIASQFGREYFDGSRETGYGGYTYDPRFWSPVVPDFIAHFEISQASSVLDVGCGKGFMLFDFQAELPGLSIAGLDVSHYAIENALPEVRRSLQIGNALELPFPDNSFDFVFSINTIHNLNEWGCVQALSEIERVARRGSFVVVDAFQNQLERDKIFAWNLTAKTILSTERWKELFKQAGFQGDYYWFTP